LTRRIGSITGSVVSVSIGFPVGAIELILPLSHPS
jgi:hypothetical protein